MSKVLIVADGEKDLAVSLKAAISQSNPLTQINICGVSELNSGAIAPGGAIVCPLTLDLPENLVFPAQDVFRFCAQCFGGARSSGSGVAFSRRRGQFLAACGVDGKGAAIC